MKGKWVQQLTQGLSVQSYAAKEMMLEMGISFCAMDADSVAYQRRPRLSSSMMRCCHVVLFSVPNRFLTTLHLRTAQRESGIRNNPATQTRD